MDGTCIGRVPGFVVAVVCGRARDGNGCLVPADRLGAADQFTDPTGLFRSVCLPRIRCCRGGPAGFPYFSGIRRPGSHLMSSYGPSKPTAAERDTRAHGGARQRSMACVPGLLGRVDRWPGTHAYPGPSLPSAQMRKSINGFNAECGLGPIRTRSSPQASTGPLLNSDQMHSECRSLFVSS